MRLLYFLENLDNPKALQSFFSDEVKKGNKDEIVKAAAYFITHRYFDNKGNIYELYDYSHSDPSLSFLTKAETIYPDIFKEIVEKKLSTKYSENGNLAYLAYVEVLSDNGYSDVAAFSTAANQYAKLAFVSSNILGGSVYEQKMIIKSLYFIKKADLELQAIFLLGLKQVSTLDPCVVIGCNQYAHARRYYSRLGVPFSSELTPEKIFSFSILYAKNKYPSLLVVAHILNASSLTMLHSPSSAIEAAAAPLVALNPAGRELKEHGVSDRILKAKFDLEEEGVYSKKNIVAIANNSISFKNWLLANGWTGSDFL